MNAQRRVPFRRQMTVEQVFSTVDAFLAPRPRQSPWNLTDYLSNAVYYLVEEWVGGELGDQKKQLVDKFAAQMTEGQLMVARAQIESRVTANESVRDAPTTQANEKPIFQGYIDQYQEFLTAIDEAVEKKEKVELVHKAFARSTGKSLPEALQVTKAFAGLGGRRKKTQKRRRVRRVTRRRRV